MKHKTNYRFGEHKVKAYIEGFGNVEFLAKVEIEVEEEYDEFSIDPRKDYLKSVNDKTTFLSLSGRVLSSDNSLLQPR